MPQCGEKQQAYSWYDPEISESNTILDLASIEHEKYKSSLKHSVLCEILEGYTSLSKLLKGIETPFTISHSEDFGARKSEPLENLLARIGGWDDTSNGMRTLVQSILKKLIVFEHYRYEMVLQPDRDDLRRLNFLPRESSCCARDGHIPDDEDSVKRVEIDFNLNEVEGAGHFAKRLKGAAGWLDTGRVYSYDYLLSKYQIDKEWRRKRFMEEKAVLSATKELFYVGVVDSSFIYLSEEYRYYRMCKFMDLQFAIVCYIVRKINEALLEMEATEAIDGQFQVHIPDRQYLHQFQAWQEERISSLEMADLLYAGVVPKANEPLVLDVSVCRETGENKTFHISVSKK